jgi:hypothetical protein
MHATLRELSRWKARMEENPLPDLWRLLLGEA